MCKHCIHAIKNLRSAMKHGKQGRAVQDDVKDLDGDFVDVITWLDRHMLYIAGSQTITYAKVSMQLMQDKLIKDLKGAERDGGQFAPKATNNLGQIKLVNAYKFASAVYLPTQGEDQRRFLGAEIANASRWSRMVSDRNLFRPFIFFVHPEQLLSQLLDECPQPSDGMTFPLSYKGESRVIASPNSTKSQIKKNQHGPTDAQGVGAAEEGLVGSTAISMCIFSAFMLFPISDVELGSGDDKATHKPKKSCDDQDAHKNMSCLNSSVPACFTIYKGEEDGDQGQPHAYSLVGQDLRLLNNTDEQGPWKITDSGKVSVDLGGDAGVMTVHLADSPGEELGGQEIKTGVNMNSPYTGAKATVDRDGGLAMSKAIAYYHFPPDWKEEPNLFAPHWKAKLQPMRIAEAVIVLGAGGKTTYLPMAIIGPRP